jgi:hypothetical protein
LDSLGWTAEATNGGDMALAFSILGTFVICDLIFFFVFAGKDWHTWWYWKQILTFLPDYMTRDQLIERSFRPETHRNVLEKVIGISTLLITATAAILLLRCIVRFITS